MTSRTWADVAEAAERQGIPSHEVRFLVEHLAHQPLALVRSVGLSARDEARFAKGVQQLRLGEPLQYVLGEWDFFGLTLQVDSRVLIPRPETESMVEAALQLLEDISAPRVIDFGTGSGAIALAVQHRRPDARVLATDAHADALSVAKANAERWQLPVEFCLGNWGAAVPDAWRGRVDLVISNPPYVAADATVEDSVRLHEPASALFAGPEGLDDLTILLQQGPEWLAEGGWILLELSPDQGTAVCEMAEVLGYQNVSLGRDLAGRIRWVMGRMGVSGDRLAN